MKFRYRRHGRELRPVVSMRVKHKNVISRCESLIDSGSDDCLLDFEVAQKLGIDVESGSMRKARGVTGQTLIYFMPH